MTDPSTDLLSLQRRIDRLEARAGIAELLQRYAFLIDDHHFDELGELFAVDAVFGSPGSTHVGRAAITQNYRDRGDLYPVSLHVVHGMVLEFSDDEHATGEVVAFSEQASDAYTVATSFRYHDAYVKVEGQWLFASRTVLTLYAMTHAELAAGGLRQDLRKRWPHREPTRAELPPFLLTPGS